MSPRHYQLGLRQDGVEESRRRVLTAARAVLADATGYQAFTVDAVARKADVARATIYYQFGSKTGLLEGLCDALAASGGMSELGTAFRNPDPEGAICEFVERFSRFWDVDRVVMRRLRALALLDPEVGAVILGRDQRRREGLAVLVGRLTGPGGEERSRMVPLLVAITSFEIFDQLAAIDQPFAEVIGEVVHLCMSALEIKSS